MSKKLKIALPKGSLQDSTVELFRKAGYNIYVCLFYTTPSPRAS